MNMNHSRVTLFCSSLLALTLLILSPCEGQDTLAFSDTIRLDDVVIVGRRSETSMADRPEAISLLNHRMIESISPMNMAEVMHAIPGVFMQQTNNGGGSPFVRGLTGYHTLILIDGIRLNNAIFRSGPNQYLNTVDPLMLSRIEVLRGPGSVQYGSDAIGGIIYLRSGDLSFSSEGLRVNGLVYGKWLSHQMEKTGRAQLQVSTRNVAVEAGYSRKDFGNITAGGDLGQLDFTSYGEDAADVKASIKLAPAQTLSLAWQHHKQNDVQLYHKLITGEYSTYAFDPQQRDLLYLRHEIQRDHSILTGIRTTLSMHQSDETRKKQHTGSDESYTEKDLVRSYGLTVELETDNTRRWSGVSGAEFYYDRVQSSTVRTDLVSGKDSLMRGLYPDQSYMGSFSAFSLHTFDFGNLILTGGVRYNHFILGLTDEIFGDLSLTPHALVGSLGASYRILRNTRLSFQIQNAFRAPNINDVSSFGIADFRYEVPNFDLAPEKSLNKELGIRTEQKIFSGSLYFYHNALKDLMVNVRSTYQGQDSIDGVQVYTRENAGKAYIRGVEGDIQIRPHRYISIHSFLIYTYGQNVTSDEPLRRIPPLNGLVGAHLHVIRNLDIMAEWQYASRQDRLSSGDLDDSRIPEGGTPGWNVINLRFSYEMAGFRINTGLLNLSNVAYRTHGSGFENMGRSFYVSLLYSFSLPNRQGKP